MARADIGAVYGVRVEPQQIHPWIKASGGAHRSPAA
jgi:hypothetical protein